MTQVLVVEDDKWLAEQHVRTLERAGMSARYVLDGLAAIDAIDQVKPDVIVLDIFLPGPSGFALLHELRSHADIGTVPVIVCSSTADDLPTEDAKLYGIAAVLDKTTVTPADLVRQVNKVLLHEAA